MDLREQETAAAVQDLEVRQMELEAQRRRLEQVTNTLDLNSFLFICNSTVKLLMKMTNLNKNVISMIDYDDNLTSYIQRHFPQHLLKKQERFGQEVEEDMEMRMRKAEREEERYTELLHSPETNLQVSEMSQKGAKHVTFDMCFVLASQQTVKSCIVTQAGV